MELQQGYNERDAMQNHDMQKKADALLAELPQEIQVSINKYATQKTGGDYIGGVKGMFKDRTIETATVGAQIASEYYEPKLAEKDAKIKEQEKAIDILERTVTQSHNETTAAIDQINKLTLLLRERLFSGDSCAGDEDYNNSIWRDYCKQHGI